MSKINVFIFYVVMTMSFLLACQDTSHKQQMGDRIKEKPTTATKQENVFVKVDIIEDGHGPDPSTDEAASMVASLYLEQLGVDKKGGYNISYDDIKKISENPVVFEVGFIKSEDGVAGFKKGKVEVKGHSARIMPDAYISVSTEDFLEQSIRQALENDGGNPQMDITPSTAIWEVLQSSHQLMSLKDGIQYTLGLSEYEMKALWFKLQEQKTFQSWVDVLKGRTVH